MSDKQKMVVIDDRGRTNLKGLVRDKDRIFQGSVAEDGTVTLVPASLVPTKLVDTLKTQVGAGARPR